jgi:alkylation response protein AidB-like acyl-CoA dehydrogenase
VAAPGELPRPDVLDPAILRAWHRTVYERGWIAPNWPRAHGGMEATLDEYLVLIEEQARVGAPYLLPTGTNLLGPALLAFGTDAQKAQHLPPILRGEVFWAQGYSEPNAGSDLAALATRAEPDGDDFLVTGRKVWSSYAHFCDWIFALVRTDPQAKPRHAGFTMLLVDLRSPGVTVRPIRTIADQLEFAEIEFDRVRVPRSGVLGPVNGGWQVANHVLVYERLSNGSPRNALMAWRRVHDVARVTGRDADPVFADRLAAVEIDFVAYLALYREAVDTVKRDESIDAVAPMLKIASTELLQKLNDLLLEAGGEAGAQWTFTTPDGGEDVLAPSFLVARRASIYGGSNEIQRNIVAARVLGFPKAW